MNESLTLMDFVRPGGLLPAAALVALSILVSRFVTGSLDGLGRRFPERRLTLQQVASLVRVGIFSVAAVAALALAFRLSHQMWVAVGGTIALSLGFALKDVSGSVLAGLVLLIDRPFQVGDRIHAAGYYGEVKSIGLRSVRLATLDDNLVSIPNNHFLTSPVASGNAGALDMMVQIDFHVGVDQNVALAKRIVRDALTSSRYAYSGKPWAIVVTEVLTESYFAVRLRAKAYVLDVQYEKAFETDVTERVFESFRAQGIAAPAVLHRSLGPASLPDGE